MTGFLASVSSMEEAQLVRSLGADVIDLKDPARGALGALDEDSVRAIASLPDKNTMLSATVGDLPAYAAELESAVTGMHACGVDIVKVGVFDRTISPFMLSVLDRLAGRGISIVLVFFAELYPLLTSTLSGSGAAASRESCWIPARRQTGTCGTSWTTAHWRSSSARPNGQD